MNRAIHAKQASRGKSSALPRMPKGGKAEGMTKTKTAPAPTTTTTRAASPATTEAAAPPKTEAAAPAAAPKAGAAAAPAAAPEAEKEYEVFPVEQLDESKLTQEQKDHFKVRSF